MLLVVVTREWVAGEQDNRVPFEVVRGEGMTTIEPEEYLSHTQITHIH